MFLIKDIVHLRKRLNFYLVNTPPAIVSTESVLLNREEKNFQYNIVGKPKEVDNFPYKRAEFLDTRNVIIQLCLLINFYTFLFNKNKEKISITHLLYYTKYSFSLSKKLLIFFQ